MDDNRIASDNPLPIIQARQATTDWITPELIALTIRTWQPYYEDLLSPEDAVTMILAVGRLYDVFSEGRSP